MNPITSGMKTTNLTVLVAFGTLLLSGCGIANKAPELPGSAVAASSYEDRLSRGIYAVAGIGPSRLEPDTSAVDGFDQDDRVEPAGQITMVLTLADTFQLKHTQLILAVQGYHQAVVLITTSMAQAHCFMLVATVVVSDVRV